MQQSPNSLQTRQPTNPMSKRPMYIAFAVVGVIALALMYALDDSKRGKKDDDSKPAVKVDERALVAGQGSGVILPPPPKTPEVKEEKAEEDPLPTVVVVQGKQDDADKEAQELRKRRQQLLMNALAAPVVKRASGNEERTGGDNDAAAGSTTAQAPGGNAARSPEQRVSQNYDPSADIDKEGFFNRADTAENGWILRQTREDGRLLEIKAGTVIPAVLISGINSDLPGVMTAQVSQDIYNTSNGRHLMIPQGSRLFGMYDSRVAYGQERVLIAWQRITFPDGSSVTLGAMPGTDMSGYSGFHDQVNNHYFRIFGSAFLMSAIIGTTAWAVDNADGGKGNSNNGDDDRTTLREEMITAMAQQMSQASMQMLQRNMNISPTLEIRPGYRFNVVVTKDVVFQESYRPHDYEQHAQR